MHTRPSLIMALSGALAILAVSGLLEFAEDIGARQQRETSSQEQRREKALFELGCERRDIITWHQLKGYVTAPKRTWVCDQVEIDDQLASILADERLAGGTSEWRLFRGHNEERRRLDSRP